MTGFVIFLFWVLCLLFNTVLAGLVLVGALLALGSPKLRRRAIWAIVGGSIGGLLGLMFAQLIWLFGPSPEGVCVFSLLWSANCFLWFSIVGALAYSVWLRRHSNAMVGEHVASAQ